MARNQKDYTYDHQMLLKSTGAVTATGVAQVAAVDRILDIGASRLDGRVVIDVSAITASSDQAYTIQVQVSNSPTFANTIVAVASKQLGVASVTGNSAATGAGRFELQFSNEENGVTYRYLRVRHVIAGTTPSINYVAYAVQQVN